jgi:hypothetical protein
MTVSEADQHQYCERPKRIAAAAKVVERTATLFATLMILISNVAGVRAESNTHDIAVRVLSSRPDAVSGGNALVQVILPQGLLTGQNAKIRILLNAKDVTNVFRRQPDGSLVGMADGLGLGKNRLAVFRGKDTGRPVVEIEITNHPIVGPIFSGPHQAPFICETTTSILPVTGGTLGPPLDADCSIRTRVDYVYKSTDGKFKPLPDSTVHPADLLETTTTEGHRVNYIVRVETGTINRAIYQTAILHDPASDSAPSPWKRQAGWNGRLIYSFGGNCAAGYHQGRITGVGFAPNELFADVTGLRSGELDSWLTQGYAAAWSTLNVFGNNCNDVLSAETMSMVKEHFIKEYGLPRYTIGWGVSGGSMQQYLIAQNYPGLLDGITPGQSFPDAITFVAPLADCALLVRAFDSSTQSWTTEQKTAVAGWGRWDFCTQQSSSGYSAVLRAGLSPTVKVGAICSAVIPPALVYDPATNPSGARCSWFDNSVNIFGRDAKTGFARRAIDNVGVQYGLLAFNNGQITAEQFLELNEKIGGFDVDGNIVANRTVADAEALRIAYESGRLNSGGGGLDSVPIIDDRPYRNENLIADVHDSLRSHIMRARLIAANGSAANQIILVGPSDFATPAGAATLASIRADALRLMDQWLGNIADDAAPYKSPLQKVVRNKPVEAVDACYGADGKKITDLVVCKSMYPVHGNPRLMAGQPLTNDILKCQLKPVDSHGYTLRMTDDQIQRLNAIFQQGVCDYTRPGVGQERLQGTWLAYPLAVGSH